jgi:hypothetical protein
MISLSATSYDPAGLLILNARVNNPYEAKRRGSVTATLDGGSSVYDSGYSITDQTLNASLKRPTKATILSLQYLTAYYSQIIVTCESGAFTCIPSYAVKGAQVSLQLRITARLDA